MDWRPGISLTALLLAVLASLVAVAAAAFAAGEILLPSYTVEVEPICRAFEQKSEKFLRHTRKEVNAGKLALAGADLEKTGLALRKTYKELTAVPLRPTAHTAEVGAWLNFVSQAASRYERAAKALMNGHGERARRLLQLHPGPAVQHLEEELHLRYCRFEPSGNRSFSSGSA